ncbi:MAG: E3 binding domain-containing protein, partial [Anaerolineae bacterium]|nr:E3 binding domain-containing protein [Anaerolineae bacterium]
MPIGTAVAVIGEQGEKYDPAALGVSGKGAAPAAPTPAPATPAEAAEVPAQQEKSSPATSAAATAPTATPGAPAEAPAPAGEGDDGRLMASPVAVRMAGELGIDLRQVKGTGPMG